MSWRRDRAHAFFWVGVLLMGALLVLSACSDPPTAMRALENLGFTEIEITGWRAFGCSDKDDYTTGFRAKGPTGRVVTGIVCSSWGWGKGATVRFD